MEEVRYTKEKEKISTLASILLHDLAPEIRPTFTGRELLDIAIQMTPEMSYVFKIMYQKKLENDEITNSEKKNPYWRLAKEDLLKIISEERLTYASLRLQSIGLINEQTGAIWGYAGGEFYITETGLAVMTEFQRNAAIYADDSTISGGA